MHMKKRSTKVRVFALLLALLMILSTGATAFASTGRAGFRGLGRRAYA